MAVRVLTCCLPTQISAVVFARAYTWAEEEQWERMNDEDIHYYQHNIQNKQTRRTLAER